MLHASSSEHLRISVDPWIVRLPTPGLVERANFVSPPRSRVSSTTSDSSLTHNEVAPLRPLPSPAPGQTSFRASDATPSTTESSPTSATSKTNAFFSSPFTIAVARLPPSQPASRSTSLTLPKSKAPRDVFDEPLVSAVNEEPGSETSTEVQTPSSGGPSRSQTASADFFFGSRAPTPAPKPVPPPNLDPVVRKKSGAGLPGLASLSRFFPSRAKSAQPVEVEPNVGTTDLTTPTPLGPNDSTSYIDHQPTIARRFKAMPGSAATLDGHSPKLASPTTPQPQQLHVPSPTKRLRQASPERILAHLNAQGLGHMPHKPIRRETDRHMTFPTPSPKPDEIIGQPDTPLKLIKELGQGAFSSVWLASDETGELALSRSASIGKGLSRQGSAGKRVTRRRRPSESWAKKEQDREMAGMRPPLEPQPEMDEAASPATTTSIPQSISFKAISSRSEWGGDKDASANAAMTSRSYGSLRSVKWGFSRLVAVKMMDRALCDANDRTRISFVREVEVLRHISHPSIVAYLHSFTIPTHHCLVLEHIAGGEIFELINDDQKHARLTETLLRRMFTELARAVAWMHSVALVHRDIKLENILLTCNPFALEYIDQGTGSPSLDFLPTPLLKLTDFGLSRFVNPESPLLATRCGSESYAAPEIVMAIKYDGRQTDAWACGVVLYALATRVLPFDDVVGKTQNGGGSIGSDDLPSPSGSVSSSFSTKGRRSYLMRIAKNEYSWPDDETTARLASLALRRIVDRLLVRDPKKRATVAELWDEDWMNGEGAMPRPGEGYRISLADTNSPQEMQILDREIASPLRDVRSDPFTDVIGEEEDGEPDADSGLLVDGENIAHVARSEIS